MALEGTPAAATSSIAHISSHQHNKEKWSKQQ